MAAPPSGYRHWSGNSQIQMNSDLVTRIFSRLAGVLRVYNGSQVEVSKFKFLTIPLKNAADERQRQILPACVADLLSSSHRAGGPVSSWRSEPDNEEVAVILRVNPSVWPDCKRRVGSADGQVGE
jgi:hypothetical protein